MDITKLRTALEDPSTAKPAAPSMADLTLAEFVQAALPELSLPPHVRTGIAHIDEALKYGMKPGEIALLGAHPNRARGKSDLTRMLRAWALR